MYALVINDRHSDIELMLFASRERAVANARQIAQGHAHPEYPEHLVMADWDGDRRTDEVDLAGAGWVFYAKWSPEGDHLFVTDELYCLDQPAR